MLIDILLDQQLQIDLQMLCKLKFGNVFCDDYREKYMQSLLDEEKYNNDAVHDWIGNTYSMDEL